MQHLKKKEMFTTLHEILHSFRTFPEFHTYFWKFKKLKQTEISSDECQDVFQDVFQDMFDFPWFLKVFPFFISGCFSGFVSGPFPGPS